MARTADPMAKSNLLRAARSEFAASGLAGARVEDIAKKASLAKGSFYLHFKSKDEAFLHIVDGFFAELGTLAASCAPNLAKIDSPADALKFFRVQDERILTFLWDNRDIVRMVHSSGDSRYAHILEAFLDAQSANTLANVQELQRKGVYRNDVDPDVIARIITGGWHEMSRRLTQLKTRPDLAGWVDTFLKLFMEGLAPR